MDSECYKGFSQIPLIWLILQQTRKILHFLLILEKKSANCVDKVQRNVICDLMILDIDKNQKRKKIILNKTDHLLDFNYLTCLIQEAIFSVEQRNMLFTEIFFLQGLYLSFGGLHFRRTIHISWYLKNPGLDFCKQED